MKILFLSSSMGMGGADSQLLAAAQEFLARGHEVQIVSLTTLGPMGLRARDLGIPTTSLEMPRGIPDPRGLLQLARLIRAWRPDVLHSHMVHANLMARAVRLVAPVPVLVSTIHNIYEGGWLLMGAYRLTNGLVDHMTIISEAAAERFVREGIVPPHLLRVVANGVDSTLYRQPAGSRDRVRQDLGVGQAFAWLAVGRFEIAKDYPNMLRAFALVRERHPETVLLLAGRGALQDETEALARELHLDSAARFLGVRDDVPALLNAADGYVMSSAWEGLPMVLLEASASGLPVVTTNVGGNAEAVLDGETGFLVAPRDHQKLASAMMRVMELPAGERERLGACGRDHVGARYGLARVVEQWEEVYREASARKGITLPSPRPFAQVAGRTSL
jgi:glycosyltransferase involved in cell wall biosynthesis